MNGWNYVNSNPVRYVDPSGNCIFLAGADTALCIAIGVGLGTLGYLTFEAVTSPEYQEAARIAGQDLDRRVARVAEQVDAIDLTWIWPPPESNTKPTITPLPPPLWQPTPVATVCPDDDDDDPDPRRLVEVGVGDPFEPITTFEELYQRYETGFDEFVAVDASVNMIGMWRRFAAFGGTTNPVRQRIVNDQRVIGRREKLSDLETDYADFLISVSPGPGLFNEIREMDRVAKPGAFIYIIIEATLENNMGYTPTPRERLKSLGYREIERQGPMSNPASNILGIPIHSAYNTATWWEFYKGSPP